jgi:hypothetical protein
LLFEEDWAIILKKRFSKMVLWSTIMFFLQFGVVSNLSIP